MIAIFYDRRNNKEVTSEQLSATRYVQYVAVGDDDDEKMPTGRRYNPTTYEAMTKESFDSALKAGYFESFDNKNPDWNTWKQEKTPIALGLREQLIGDLCYKSPDCPKHMNWDLHTTTNDLIFLRLEDTDTDE